MTLHLQMPSQVNNLSPRILVIGVGGAGGNIINSMKESGVEGVEFLNVNTDSQQLKNSKVEKTLQLGPSCTMGLGAGADPNMGKKAADEVAGEIEEYIEGSHMVFLTAGMGGGTGTGASPVVARIAKELGILTVGVVTKPFEMEGKRKIKRAEEGIAELQKYGDNLIVIPNQNIFHLAKPETSFTDSLQFADNVLIDGVKSDIKFTQYETIDQLLNYCHKVAGVVGIMFCEILGIDDNNALIKANDLGIAMQLTNIARDVIEDSGRNRKYIDNNFNKIKETIKLADTFYNSSFRSISEIPISCRFAILVARRVYRQIGNEIIKKRDFEDYKRSGKIFVTKLGKVKETFLSIYDFILLLFLKPNKHNLDFHHFNIRREINLDDRF